MVTDMHCVPVLLARSIKTKQRWFQGRISYPAMESIKKMFWHKLQRVTAKGLYTAAAGTATATVAATATATATTAATATATMAVAAAAAAAADPQGLKTRRGKVTATQSLSFFVLFCPLLFDASYLYQNLAFINEGLHM